MDRLTSAAYSDWTINNAWNQVDEKFESTFKYDLDGNLTRLTRNGALNPCRVPEGSTSEGYDYGLIDNLVYIYSGLNQLSTVYDAGGSPFRGFQNGSSNYSYDGAGNLISDSGKGLNIQHNYLNLPGQMDFAQGSIQLKYGASGKKLQKAVLGGDDAAVIDYVGSIEYKDGELSAIHFSQGRVIKPERATRNSYQFNLKDHLGNVRVLFEDKNQNGSITQVAEVLSNGQNVYIAEDNELLSVYHYYPD